MRLKTNATVASSLLPREEAVHLWRRRFVIRWRLWDQVEGTSSDSMTFCQGMVDLSRGNAAAFVRFTSSGGRISDDADSGSKNSDACTSSTKPLAMEASAYTTRSASNLPLDTASATQGSEASLPTLSCKALGRRRDAGEPSETRSPGLLSVLGAIAGLARGMGGVMGLGVGHTTFGLQALARRHEALRLTDHPEGRPLPPGAATQAKAEWLLDALELAHGAYRRSAVKLAATTCLRSKQVRVWRPEGGSLQPGYYVAVDHIGRRVVWGVRGTRVLSDLMTDLAMVAHPLGGGSAHWGMTHAAHWLLQQEASRVAALLRALGPPGAYRLQLVGHSLGGAVAALAAMMLREGLVEAARAASIPPELVSCVAFAPPAVLSPELASLCRPYVTSVVLNNDIVPRFNATSLAALQDELRSVDWYGELQQTVMEHTLAKSLSTTLEALISTPGGNATAPAISDKQQQQQRQQEQPNAAHIQAAPASPQLAAAAAGAAAMVQQLSAAVLESAAFKGAVQALDDWKAKAVTAAAGDQPEVVVRRQLDLVQAWLQDVAALKRQGAGEDSGAGDRSGTNQSLQSGTPHRPDRQMDPAAAAADAAADVRRAAEAAAERLRQSVDAAVASLAAAAEASRDRISASLPALPSLPQPHELPLIETATAAAAAAETAAAVAGNAAAADSREGGVGEAAASTSVSKGFCEGISAGAAARDAESAVPVSLAATGAPSRAGPGFQPAGQQTLQELPLMLPPGRIIYIRARHGEHRPLPSSAQQMNLQQSAKDAHNLQGRRLQDGGAGGDGSTAASDAMPECTGYMVTELPPGGGFQRLILGRSALEEHQCKAYRRVLIQLAFKVEPEYGI